MSDYGEGYWKRGEGSNYHGYADDPGWMQTAVIVASHHKHPMNLLELGAASGYFVRACRRLRIDARGIDISDYAVRQAPPETAEYLEVGPATDLGHIEDETVDAVCTWELLEHLDDWQIADCLDEINRVLVPGGMSWNRVALATDGVPGYEHIPAHDAHADSTHVSLFLPEWWRGQFENRLGYERFGVGEIDLNESFRDRDWRNRFFVYRKPDHEEKP